MSTTITPRRRSGTLPESASDWLTFPRSGDVTFDEFVATIRDGEKADLLDGVIYMASPDNTNATDLNSWLDRLVGCFVAETDLGTTFVSRVAYRVDETHGPEPDLGVVLKRRSKDIKRGHVLGGPDVAIEIVSPDSVYRDYVQKREIYERAGVKEYWIIDPDKQRATFLRLVRDRFREVALEKEHVFRSNVLPGFWLDVRWLWMKRRPSTLRFVQQMLKDR